MSIILRTNKGSALTYDEMDRNLSQFFYSGSVSPDGASLRLHFTGSDALDLVGGEDYGPRYVSIPFPANDITIPDAVAAGDNREIQYNNNGVFGASSNLVFRDNKLGIGEPNPSVRVDVRAGNGIPAKIALRGRASDPQAEVGFYDGATLIGKIGRTDINELNNIYITNNKPVGSEYGKVHISIGDSGFDDNDIVIGTFKTGNLFGVGTKDPNRQGSFVGAQGIGISLSSVNTNQSYLSPIPYEIYSATIGGLKKLIPNGSDENGLLISSPNSANGGNIVVALNTDGDQKEGFNIIKSISNINGSFATANTSLIATFQASGKVGINTNFPSDVGLTVAGIISGSGNAQIDGTLTVKTVAAVTATGTNKTLVTDSNGLVNYLPAAPVPFGGIIMWSGNTNAVPEGWVLCNLNSSVTTGLGTRFVPDLTNKFIIGWNGVVDGLGPKTDITGTDTVSGGNKNAVLVAHAHTATTTVSSHRHQLLVKPGVMAASTADNPGGAGQGSRRTMDSGTDNNAYTEYDTPTAGTTIGTTGKTATGATNNSQTGENANLPPYYALAFIMYVGV